jgi:hypothetical protein
MWHAVIDALVHLSILFLALLGLWRFRPFYGKQVQALRRPLSNPVGGQRPIQGAASRLDGPALDCSSDHSSSDFSHSGHRIFSDSYL